jgi:rubrerythrin
MQRRKRNDNCPICDNSLYLDSIVSKRVGILNEFDEVEEWMCPFCETQFTLKDKPTVLYGTMNVEGEA